MELDRWDAWLERVILGLVAGALGFAILALGGVRLREFLVVEGLVALAALVWLIRLWTNRSHRLLWPPACWGALVFAGWAVWRSLGADLPYVAWGELLRILTYTTLFFVVVNNLHRQDTAHGLTWFLVGLATLLCFYGAWQFATASNRVWGFDRGGGYGYRASGSYVCPNHFAGLLELLIPVSLATLIAGRVRPLGRILLGYCVFAMLAGLALTISRGGWLAAAAGMAFVLISLVRHQDYRWPALAVLALLLVCGTVVVGRARFAQNRLLTADDLNPQARNTRPPIWRAAVHMWQDQPWLGVGPAHFAERFKQYRTHWAYAEPERAHNDYLDVLADWGVAGATLIGGSLILLGWGVARTLRRVRRDPGNLEAKRSSRYAFVLGTAGGLVALLVHSLTDFNFHIPANAMVAVTGMALLAGYSRYATDDWWVSSRRPWRHLLTPLILALIGLLAWDIAHRGRETQLLERARRARDGSEVQVQALQAAWNLEPRNAWTAYRLGEAYRIRSFTGARGYEQAALEALEWFERATKVNPFNPIFRFRAGMCLDWLGRHEEATPYYDAAVKVDPEGRITSFHRGWHAMQRGNDDEAREWFLKSTQQGWPPYADAETYLWVLERRKADRAATPPSAPATNSAPR